MGAKPNRNIFLFGQTFSSLGRFVDSIFELVDIWTETTEESEYLELLDLLTQGITKVRSETERTIRRL